MSDATTPDASNLKLRQYTRLPFDVTAEQVTMENVHDIAAWCGGEVTLTSYKVMGAPTKLPCVKVPSSSGPKAGRIETALLNYWVVKQGDDSFRVYRPSSFKDAFEQKSEAGFQLGCYVRIVNRAAEQFDWVGQVMEVEPDLIQVDFESRNDDGRFHPDELEKFEPTKNMK